MAYTGIMTTEADIDQKTGAGVSSAFTDVMKTAATLRAESFCNTVASYNFSDNYAALNVDVKYLLSEIVSCMVAIEGIAYTMKGYLNIREAENKINVLRDIKNQALAVLRVKNTQDFMNNA